MRVLRPPVGIEVLTRWEMGSRRTIAAQAAGEDDAGLPPVEIRSLPGDEAAKRPRIEGEVRVASGPWGLEEDWWDDDPAGRDYWDVEIAGRGLYRIFRERATGDWYADGIYD